MKTIKIKELRNLLANKLGLECKAETFAEFRGFIEDIYSQFNLRFTTLSEQAEYSHNANICDCKASMNTKFLKSMFDTVDKKLGVTDGDCSFYNNENFNGDVVDSLDKYNEEHVEIDYVDNKGISVTETLNVWREACQNSNEEVVVKIGTLGKEESYCDLDLTWLINQDKIESKNSFVQIDDDNDEKLMDCLYWLCECFANDTFEEFEQLGVEIRLQEV